MPPRPRRAADKAEVLNGREDDEPELGGVDMIKRESKTRIYRLIQRPEGVQCTSRCLRRSFLLKSGEVRSTLDCQRTMTKRRARFPPCKTNAEKLPLPLVVDPG